MTRLVTASLLLILVALPASAQDGTKFTAHFAPKAPTGFGASGERGFALGDLASAVGGTNNRLAIVDRDANLLLFMDPVTGNELGTLSTADLTGGFYNVNDASISEDGAIVVCNLTLNASTNAFKCYTSPDDNGPFTEIVNYTAALGDRLGDKMTAVGSVSGNTLSIYAVSGNSGRVYRFDSGSFGSPTVLSLVEEDGLTSVTTLGTSPSAGPLSTGVSEFWVNGNGINPMKFNSAGQRIATLSGVLAGTGNNAIRAFSAGSSQFIASFEYTTTAPTYGRVAVVNVTGFPTSTATLYDRGLNVGGGATGLGDVEIHANGDGTFTACVLGASFGVTCGFTNQAPLPVELVSFDGFANGTSVQLRWRTASETNNAGFDVQLQAGASWQTLGFVAGRGTTAEAQQYAFDASGLAPGRHVFRLVQRDFDGAFSYSPEVEIEVDAGADFAVSGLYPNPTREAANLSVYLARPQAVKAELYDAVGRRVAVVFDGLMAEGTTPLAVATGALPAGVYMLRVTGERTAQTQQLTVVR